jgi:hypothetical protein
MNSYALVFKSRETREKFRQMIGDVFNDTLYTRVVEDMIETVNNGRMYLILEDDLEVQMRGRSITDFFYMDGSVENRAGYESIWVAKSEHIWDEYKKILSSE